MKKGCKSFIPPRPKEWFRGHKDYLSPEYWKNKKLDTLKMLYVICRVCSEDIVKGEECFGNSHVFAHRACVENLKPRK